MPNVILSEDYTIKHQNSFFFQASFQVEMTCYSWDGSGQRVTLHANYMSTEKNMSVTPDFTHRSRTCSANYVITQQKGTILNLLTSHFA